MVWKCLKTRGLWVHWFEWHSEQIKNAYECSLKIKQSETKREVTVFVINQRCKESKDELRGNSNCHDVMNKWNHVMCNETSWFEMKWRSWLGAEKSGENRGNSGYRGKCGNGMVKIFLEDRLEIFLCSLLRWNGKKEREDLILRLRWRLWNLPLIFLEIWWPRMKATLKKEVSLKRLQAFVKTYNQYLKKSEIWSWKPSNSSLGIAYQVNQKWKIDGFWLLLHSKPYLRTGSAGDKLKYIQYMVCICLVSEIDQTFGCVCEWTIEKDERNHTLDSWTVNQKWKNMMIGESFGVVQFSSIPRKLHVVRCNHNILPFIFGLD